jgi:hypothetical protein
VDVGDARRLLAGRFHYVDAAAKLLNRLLLLDRVERELLDLLSSFIWSLLMLMGPVNSSADGIVV